MMKNMEQISVQSLQVNNVTNAVAEYDSNFVVLLPRTIITEDMLKIFQETYLNAIVSDEPLSLKSDIGDLFEEDEQNDDIDTANDSKSTHENGDLNTESFLDDHQFVEEDDPYVIARVFTEYGALYESAHSLLFNFSKKGALTYQDIQQFVCNEVVPKVKQCSYPYLAIGNMPVDADRNITSELAIKLLLLTLAVLEQNKAKQPFFRSIDKRIEIGICAFASYICAMNIEDRINKTVDFTEYKAREVLINFSAKTLYKKHFPSYVIDVIANMRPYQANATNLQYKEENNEINTAANLLTIIDYYMQSVTLKEKTPFQTMKTIIDDRYNFNTENIKLFTRSIGIIPIGCHVKLKNKCHAIIRRFSKNSPQMPEVHLVTNAAEIPQSSLVHIATEKHEYNIVEISSYETGVKMANMYIGMFQSKYQTRK